MKKQLLLGTILTLCSGLFSQVSVAQGIRLPGVIQRMEISYSYSVAMATYERTDKVVRSDGSVFEENYKEDVTSSFGWGGGMSTTVPLKRIGGKCMLGLGVGYTYSMFTWDYKTRTLFTDEDGDIVYDTNELPFTGASMQMTVPLSADFKFGNDAFLNKSSRWGTTLGVGVLPAGAVTADFDNAGFGFGAAPFVKAEVSLFAGICWKVRAQYAFGYLPFYDVKNSLAGWSSGYSGQSSLLGKQQLSVSLVLMPFSWAWKETGWWNRY